MASQHFIFESFQYRYLVWLSFQSDTASALMEVRVDKIHPSWLLKSLAGICNGCFGWRRPIQDSQVKWSPYDKGQIWTPFFLKSWLIRVQERSTWVYSNYFGFKNLVLVHPDNISFVVITLSWDISSSISVGKTLNIFYIQGFWYKCYSLVK